MSLEHVPFGLVQVRACQSFFCFVQRIRYVYTYRHIYTNVHVHIHTHTHTQGEDGKKFKTRSGDTVKLRDLLDEAGVDTFNVSVDVS